MSEELYHKLRKTLKGLPPIGTRTGFEQRLYQRIRLVDSETLAKQLSDKYSQKPAGWYLNLFRPSLAPALGLTAAVFAAIIVLFLVLTPSGETPISETEKGNEVSTETAVTTSKTEDGFIKQTEIAKIEQKSKEVKSLPDDQNIKRKEVTDTRADYPEYNSDYRTTTVSTEVKEPVREAVIEQSISTPVRVEEKVEQPKEEEVKIEKKSTVPEVKQSVEENKSRIDQRISKQTYPFGGVSVLPRDSVTDTTNVKRSRKSDN